MKSTRWKRLGILVCAALLLIVAGTVAVLWYDSRERDNGGNGFLADLREVRGPRDLWDLITGRRVRELDLMEAVKAREEVELQLAQQKAESGGGDCPMFGGTVQRNMVNLAARNIPTQWSVEEGKHENIKWMAELGTKAFGGPVIADGKVFMGTNNGNPRDKAVKGAKAILMCFDEATGKFLWQQVHDFPADELFKEARGFGLFSTPVVEGTKHWYVTPGCEVICGDNATGKVLWRYDMMKELKVVPYHTANCSPLIVDGLVMVVTGNGVDDEGKIPSPKAPSFAAFDKDKGTLAWQSNLPGDKLIEGQWSNPTVAVVKGKNQVIFPGGDSWLYSFEPKTGKLIWKFNCNPQPDKKGRTLDPYFVATPVVVGERLYIGVGAYPGDPQATRFAHVLCIDVTKSGDVSPKSLDTKDPANKNSALVWAFGGPIIPRPAKGREAYFGYTSSTCAVVGDFLYIAECTGYVHCLDAKTGQRHWVHDVKGSVWGSPYYVDGKVYVGTEDSEVVVYQHGANLKVLAKNDMGDWVHSTPVVANGVLFVSTDSKLYAIAEKK